MYHRDTRYAKEIMGRLGLFKGELLQISHTIGNFVADGLLTNLHV